MPYLFFHSSLVTGLSAMFLNSGLISTRVRGMPVFRSMVAICGGSVELLRRQTALDPFRSKEKLSTRSVLLLISRIGPPRVEIAWSPEDSSKYISLSSLLHHRLKIYS